MFRLVSISALPPWEFPLKPGLNSLGRGLENDFQVDDSSVSTRHCHIRVGPAAIRIEDLGSTNGTFVDGTQVAECYVNPGQVIRFGNIDFRVVLTNPAVATPETDSPTRMRVEVRPKAGPSGPLGPSVTADTDTQIATAQPMSRTEAAAEESTDEAIFCRNHYRNLARFFCAKCRHYFCDLCVNTRGSSAGGLKFCKVCGNECRPVAVKPITKPTDFFEAAPQAFKYPFVGDGWFLLIGGFLFFGFLDLSNYISRHAFTYAARAMMMRAVALTFIMGTGYLFSYLKKIIACTIEGEEQMPDWPEFAEWKEDIVVPMFQFTVIALVSFSPALLVYLWWEGDYMWAVWSLALLGCIYFPMAWLGVAIFDSLVALNPMFVVGSILRVHKEYAVAAGVFAAIIVLRWLEEALLTWILPVPVVPALLSDLFAIVLLMVEARILGLLYRSQKPILGWLRN